MELSAANVKMKEIYIIFPWIKKIRKRLLKSLHKDNADDQLLLQQYLHEEFQKLFYNQDKKRSEAFYKTISYFYLHFCWRVNWNKDYPMKFSCVQLLYYMVFVGLMLSDGDVKSHWMDRVLTVLKSFPGDTYLMFDALLLIQMMKKKYREAFALILWHILCEEMIKSPSNSESFMKLILLFRRLNCLSKDHVKKSTISSLASSVKCPSDFVNWTSLNISNLSGLRCENAVEYIMNRNFKGSAMKNIFQVLFGNKYDEKIISPVELQKDSKKIKSPRKKKIDEESKHVLPSFTKCNNESSVSKSKQTRKEIHSQDITSSITLLVKETASVSHQQKKGKLNSVKYSEISTPSSRPEINDIESCPVTQEKSSDSISAYANYTNEVNHSFSPIDNSSKDQWSFENTGIFNSTLTPDLKDQNSVSNNELNHVCNISINPSLILSDCKSNTESFSLSLHNEASDYGIDDTIKFTNSSDIEMTATPPLSYEKINLSKSYVCQNVSSSNFTKKQKSKKVILSLDNIPLDEQAIPKVNVNDVHASLLETFESTSNLNTQQKSPSQSVNPLNASTAKLSPSKCFKLSSVNSTKRKRSGKLKKSVKLRLNSDSDSCNQKSTINCIKSSVEILDANNVGDSSLNLQLKCNINSSRMQKSQNFLSGSERDSHSDINLAQNKIHTALNVSDAKSNCRFSTFETQSNSYHLDQTSHFKKKNEKSAMFVSKSDSSSSQISKISTDGLNKLSKSNSVAIETFQETLSFRKPDSSDSDSDFHSVSSSDCCYTDYFEESSLNTNPNSLVKEISTSNEYSKIQPYSDNQKTLCTLSPKSQKLVYCNSILENSKDFKKASLTFEKQEERLLTDINSELCQTPSRTVENYLEKNSSNDVCLSQNKIQNSVNDSNSDSKPVTKKTSLNANTMIDSNAKIKPSDTISVDKPRYFKQKKKNLLHLILTVAFVKLLNHL